MDSFAIKSIKSYDTYLNIQMTSNKKIELQSCISKSTTTLVKSSSSSEIIWESCKVFRAAYRCRFKPQTGSDSITIGIDLVTQNNTKETLDLVTQKENAPLI
jgi:hypothetical protein